MNSVTLSDVSVRFNGKPVLDGASLTLTPGKLVGLIGPNGAGKTTLLRAIAHLIPYQGTITLDGTDIAAIAPRRLARRLAYMPQGHEIHWPLDVGRVVALGRLPHLSLFRTPTPADLDAIETAIRRAQIGDLTHRNVLTLSGGERARVMLARALAVEAGLLLADEPVAALDPYHQLHIMEVLRDLARDGRTIVVVTHDLTLAGRFCDRLVLLDRGRIVADGDTPSVLQDDLLAQVYHVETLHTRRDGQSLVIPWRCIDAAPPAGLNRNSTSP